MNRGSGVIIFCSYLDVHAFSSIVLDRSYGFLFEGRETTSFKSSSRFVFLYYYACNIFLVQFGHSFFNTCHRFRFSFSSCLCIYYIRTFAVRLSAYFTGPAIPSHLHYVCGLCFLFFFSFCLLQSPSFCICFLSRIGMTEGGGI